MARGSTSTEALGKLHSSLAESAHPRFIGRRLILPCVDHSIKIYLYNIAPARANSRTLRTPMSRNPDTFEMI
ncbi:hypothetical protein M404DRAFT_998082 [Pisolithus tinctorius Marx 270]|uniref:Uncharacterized protein n=1 Tax=Pisolithus tinctorius Marx 270 TaxID=870435 RepID=A0A0C3KCI4_PISTI|nr:hypothetical protein M404DRAFT_998082 [Pisolithus tinctorius Marx 270]